MLREATIPVVPTNGQAVPGAGSSGHAYFKPRLFSWLPWHAGQAVRHFLTGSCQIPDALTDSMLAAKSSCVCCLKRKNAEKTSKGFLGSPFPSTFLTNDAVVGFADSSRVSLPLPPGVPFIASSPVRGC